MGLFSFLKKQTLTGSIEGMHFLLNEEGTGYILEKASGCTEKSVKIDMYNAKPVVEIRPEAFAGCGELAEVILGEGLRVIGDGAFRKCKGLSAIRLPEGLEEIGAEAFLGCEGLKELTLPRCLRRLGKSAFAYCEGLEQVILQGQMPEFEDTAFYGCTGLQRLEVGEGIRRIGKGAFHSCVKLCSILFPEGLEEIGKEAFLGCKALKKLTLPDSVVALGDGAFSECSELERVRLSQNLREIGREAFSFCYALEEIPLPESLERVGALAFLDCGKLRLEIPRGLSSLGGGVFSGVPAEAWSVQDGNPYFLKDGEGLIQIKEGCVVMGRRDGVIPADGSIRAIAEYAFYEYEELSCIPLPQGLLRIGDRAFDCCFAMEYVTLPNTVREIAGNPFTGLRCLKEIRLEEGNPRLCIQGNCLIDQEEGRVIAAWGHPEIPRDGSILVLEDSAFGKMAEDTAELHLPASLKEIRKSAFAFCGDLARLSFDGTCAEWRQISKGDLWCFATRIEEVLCIDGTVSVREEA